MQVYNDHRFHRLSSIKLITGAKILSIQRLNEPRAHHICKHFFQHKLLIIQNHAFRSHICTQTYTSIDCFFFVNDFRNTIKFDLYVNSAHNIRICILFYRELHVQLSKFYVYVVRHKMPLGRTENILLFFSCKHYGCYYKATQRSI